VGQGHLDLPCGHVGRDVVLVVQVGRGPHEEEGEAAGVLRQVEAVEPLADRQPGQLLRVPALHAGKEAGQRQLPPGPEQIGAQQRGSVGREDPDVVTEPAPGLGRRGSAGRRHPQPGEDGGRLPALVQGVGPPVEPVGAPLVGAGPPAGLVPVEHQGRHPAPGRRRRRRQPRQPGPDHHHVVALVHRRLLRPIPVLSPPRRDSPRGCDRSAPSQDGRAWGRGPTLRRRAGLGPRPGRRSRQRQRRRRRAAYERTRRATAAANAPSSGVPVPKSCRATLSVVCRMARIAPRRDTSRTGSVSSFLRWPIG